nr:MAG TPA: hypothetical protein [Caudoviricetes sp.]
MKVSSSKVNRDPEACGKRLPGLFLFFGALVYLSVQNHMNMHR